MGSKIALGVFALFMAAVLYASERPWSLTSAPRVREIDRALGTDHATNDRFPWWENVRGWAAALMLGLWFFLYRREAERREDARWEAA